MGLPLYVPLIGVARYSRALVDRLLGNTLAAKCYCSGQPLINTLTAEHFVGGAGVFV